MNIQSGIVTGTEIGYSRWQQDEHGWRLVYADGSIASGYKILKEDGTQADQVIWEKINGAYYAFGVNGYLISGWIYDHQLNEWYYVTEANGMRSGWYNDTRDEYTYYLDVVRGALVHGWKKIDGKCYYFNEIPAVSAWIYDSKTENWYYNDASKGKPFGALYQNEITPDGYKVNDSGVWDGKMQ